MATQLLVVEGRGGGDAGLPDVVPPELAASTVEYGETHAMSTASAPQPPQPPQTSKLKRVLSVVSFRADSRGPGTSAARRRRTRWLRSWLRQERMTVRMALAGGSALQLWCGAD